MTYELRLERLFDAPPEVVFDTLVDPDAQEELFADQVPGWSLLRSEIDLRVGGKYRYVWRHDRNGNAMGMSGVYHEIVRPERIVNTESFDEPWYPGEAVGTLVLTEERGRTTVTQTVLYASRDARDGVLESPMESGVAASYDRLEDVLTAAEAK